MFSTTLYFRLWSLNRISKKQYRIYETVTRANFLRNAYHIIKVKIHLHHSHTTDEIFGYVYDFCNWRVRENKTEFSCIAHNLF